MKSENVILSILCLALLVLSGNLRAQSYETTLYPSQDCYVANPTASAVAVYNTSSMPISEASGGATRALMQFDLSSIPREAMITAATFSYTIASGSSSLQMQVAISSWDQSTVTWNNQPYGNDAYLSVVPLGTTINGSPGAYSVDVTNTVAYMVSRQMLNGWRFMKTTTTNTITMYSSEASVSLRPKLWIKYWLPLKVEASVVPATGPSTADGSIDVTVSGGSSSYSYAWYRNYAAAPVFSTTQDVSGLLPGAYRLLVTDNNTSRTSSQYVIVGNILGSTTVTLQPDGVFGHDANTRYDIASSNGPASVIYTNYGADGVSRSGRLSPVLSRYHAHYLKFMYLGVEEGNSIQMENAILNMYGAVHSSTVTSFKLNKVSTPWYESSITDVNRPLDPSSMEKVIDPGPVNGSNPNVSINITDIAQYHSQYPDQNQGYSLDWFTSGSSGVNNYFSFYSSDAAVADSSKRPALVLTFRTKKDFAELSEKPDARVHPVNGLLKFIYRERYQDSNSQLSYTIYRVATNQTVATQANNPLTVKYGDNRYVLNLRTLAGGLSPDIYILEVMNEKKEKNYLRFKLN